jgi:hypothetical protein
MKIGINTALLVALAMAPPACGFHFSSAENPARVVFTEHGHVIVVSGARVVSVIPAFFIGGGEKR